MKSQNLTQYVQQQLNFLLDNNKNSITVNNLIMFQQFQAYLKHEKFDKLKAKDIALKYLRRRGASFGDE